MFTTFRQLGRAVLVLGLALTAGTAAFAQSDPFAGTWQLNVDQSEFTSRSGPIAERTIVIMPEGKMWMHEQHTQRQNGRGVEVIKYEATYDGKDYMVIGAAFDAVSFTRMGNTMTRTAKNRGQQVETATYTLSPDMQTLTIVTKGMNYGITYGSTQVFERETDASN